MFVSTMGFSQVTVKPLIGFPLNLVDLREQLIKVFDLEIMYY